MCAGARGVRALPTTPRTTTTSGAGRSSTTSRLYEKLCLEGFQSGLSWLTILRKRENFRRAFKGFDPRTRRSLRRRRRRAAARDAGIVRHRGKIEATIANAHAALAAQREHGSLAALFWSFEPTGRRRAPRAFADIPSQTPESKACSKALARARLPLRRPDDGLRRDAVVRHRRRPPRRLQRAARVRSRRARSARGQFLLDRLGDLGRLGLDDR